MVKIIALIGNICSGKTTLAKIIESKGFTFLPVESIKKTIKFKSNNQAKNQELLYKKYISKIIKMAKNKSVIIESTGGNKFWMPSYKKLKKIFGKELLVIKVDAGLNTCLKRFKKSKHGHRAHATEDLLLFIHKKLQGREVPYDVLIPNDERIADFRKHSKIALSKYIS